MIRGCATPSAGRMAGNRHPMLRAASHRMLLAWGLTPSAVPSHPALLCAARVATCPRLALGVPMLSATFAGFLSGLSLIAAIGAQNAFVLRQGIKREHVGLVVALCALSDALLIAAGVAGFNAAAGALPWLVPLFLWGGVAFLLVYGALRVRAGWRGGAALTATGAAPVSARRVALTGLALTWLNPHVYLDTLALLGALSAQYTPYEAGFGLGAVLASGIFFAALGYGARLLAPVMARPTSWRWLEFGIGAVMWAIAASLVMQALSGGQT